MDDGGTMDLRLECRRHPKLGRKWFTFGMDSDMWPKCPSCRRNLKVVRGRRPRPPWEKG